MQANIVDVIEHQDIPSSDALDTMARLIIAQRKDGHPLPVLFGHIYNLGLIDGVRKERKR